MPNTKKILITTESREIFIARRGEQRTIRGFCETCAAEVEMLPLDEAVSFTGKSTLELIRLTEAGAIHPTETASGHLLVCQNSLKNFLQDQTGERK